MKQSAIILTSGILVTFESHDIIQHDGDYVFTPEDNCCVVIGDKSVILHRIDLKHVAASNLKCTVTKKIR